MPCFRCGSDTVSRFARQRGGLRGLSRAAARYAQARRRDSGRSAVSADWRRRLTVCRSCPLYVLVDGEAYCGRPLWQRPLFADKGDADSDPGCGCPLRDKARDPNEHCPLMESTEKGRCACKWCRREPEAAPSPSR